MIAALKKIFAPAPYEQEAHTAYKALVEQARAPFLYTECEIDDTIDGRFDTIILHVFLLSQRLRKEPELAEFDRAVQEVFFADMDRSLREMGASDTGLGKRIKKMAVAFFGRMQAYEQATNEAEFKEALQRNLYRGKAVSEAALAKLYAYVETTHKALAQKTASQLLG